MTMTGLTLLALGMSIVSMTFSIAALWPDRRETLEMIRNAVLWAALAFVAVAVLTVAWERRARRTPRYPKLTPAVSPRVEAAEPSQTTPSPLETLTSHRP